MPKAARDERYFHDIQHAYESLHSVLAPRGLYAEVGMMLLVNMRRPAELRDISVELVIRGRAIGSPVWRVAETLKVPGRMKLRSVSSVLFGLMMRATYDIEASIPIPGDDRPPPVVCLSINCPLTRGARIRSWRAGGRARQSRQRDACTTCGNVVQH
jgi:hypothetical protein